VKKPDLVIEVHHYGGKCTVCGKRKEGGLVGERQICWDCIEKEMKNWNPPKKVLK